jgi:glycosyltransferase involved in cell wall biosynthesis
MQTGPRFSVITPVFNGMPWLPQAITSVDRQRADVELEHLILDAGSTDGSREHLKAHAPHAVVVMEPDRGQTDALIKGFARARGDILCWLNADDLLEDGALRRVSEAFDRHPAASTVSGACLLIREDGSVLGALPTLRKASHQDLLNTVVNLGQPATFFTRRAYEGCGGMDPRMDLTMDVDLWFRLVKQGEVVMLPDQLLARFRIHPGARSVKACRAAAREDLTIRLREGLSPLSGVARILAQKSVLPLPVDAVVTALYEAVRGARGRTQS